MIYNLDEFDALMREMDTDVNLLRAHFNLAPIEETVSIIQAWRMTVHELLCLPNT